MNIFNNNGLKRTSWVFVFLQIHRTRLKSYFHDKSDEKGTVWWISLFSPNTWIQGVYPDHPNIRLPKKSLIISKYFTINWVKKEWFVVYHSFLWILGYEVYISTIWAFTILPKTIQHIETFCLLALITKTFFLKRKMFRLKTMQNNASSTYMCEYASHIFPRILICLSILLWCKHPFLHCFG